MDQDTFAGLWDDLEWFRDHDWSVHLEWRHPDHHIGYPVVWAFRREPRLELSTQATSFSLEAFVEAVAEMQGVAEGR